MASPPAAWDCRVVASWPSNAEPVTALYEPRVRHRSVELADYRTEYRLLGSLEVVDRGEAVPTGGQRKRALLARLLLEANRTVSIDALVDALWGERVPATAVKMVHIYVSQLRKVLPGGVLQTRAPGYRLEVAPEAVDLLRFERLRKEGREALAGGDAVTAAERLTVACALWRGTALGEFSEPFAAAAAAHLDELRLVAVEDRVDAELALGRHRELVGELQALVASHPFRERPRRQLMLALYRQGRHAEALAAFQELRAATTWGSTHRRAWPSCSTASSTRIRPSTMPRRPRLHPIPAGPGTPAARRRRVRQPGGRAGPARAGSRGSDGRTRRARPERWRRSRQR